MADRQLPARADVRQLEAPFETKPVPGFPRYEVTSDGRVISYQRREPSFMSPGVDAKGYLGVTLCNGPGVRRVIRVHRLVAEAFIPNPHDLPCVRHLDGKPSNNRLENLAWGTYSQNEDDKKEHGTYHRRRNNVLIESDVLEVRRLRRNGARQVEIAKRMGVSRPTITRILNGTIWGDVQ